MNTLNFLASGLMGDFIHSLCACKNICQQKNVKADLYIAEGWLGDPFRFGVQKAYIDTFDLISSQDYINKYELLPNGFSGEIINLNRWRTEVHTTYNKTGGYNKNWTTLMSETFDYPIGEYKWLSTENVDEKAKDRILIHRSKQRHSYSYRNFFNTLQEKPLFITTNEDEYNFFEFKDYTELHLVNTISEMAIAINSSKLFIGNQSSPFALACALDVNRICELDSGDASPFYIGEDKFSGNINFI